MNYIKIMDELLANKIAAGEVVEKCVSVVKELVENSIDAKAKRIKIELIESGVREIKVIDDGIGMSREDATLAFLPHATSKIINEDDLFHISSLGFRGEALPSIASISEIILKTSTGDSGTVIHLKGGKTIKTEVGDARVGTIVIVSNLFYNTPARLKHLGSLYAELANIVDYIHKIALSHPDISFILVNDNKTIFETDGSNNQLKVIKEIYGINTVRKMLEISANNDDYEISGFVSMPEITKSNRNHIITLVNGRVVKNIELNKAIIDSYHTKIPINQYPIVILNIKVDPSLIDVNIHPTKMDIKFSKINDLKEMLTNTISSKLNKNRVIVSPVIKEENNDNYKVQSLELDRNNIEKENIFDNYTETIEINEYLIADNNNEYITETIVDNKIPELYPVGLVKGTYIICQNELGMYMIDQHAAKERINYEYYLKVLGKNSHETISMLFPITIEFPYNEYIIIKENITLLLDMGFEIDELGSKSFVIRSHPTWLPKGYESEALKQICDLIIVKERDFTIEKFNERVAISLSCKMAIKANENISHLEMETLINDLRNCNDPYTCPHGRPTIIFYSNYDLERLFKRAM